MEFLEDVHVTPLKTFTTTGGQVMRGVRKNDIGVSTFGEAYFTSIDMNTIRGWKLHKLMVSNLIVPVGSVKFVLCILVGRFYKFLEVQSSRNPPSMTILAP